MALCSVSSNPLTQFTKHLQTDRGLQRDRVVKRNGTGYQGFKTGTRQHSQAVDEFAQFNSSAPDLFFPGHARQRQLEFDAQPSPQWSGAHTSGLPWTSDFNNGNFGTMRASVLQHQPYLSEEQNTHSFQKQPRNLRSAASQNSLKARTQSNIRYAYPSATNWGQFQPNTGVGMDWASSLVAPSEQTQFTSATAVLEKTMEDFNWEALFASLDASSQTTNADTEPAGSIPQESSAVPSTLVDEIEDSVAPPISEQKSHSVPAENVSPNDRFADGMLIVSNGDNLSLAAIAFEDACRADPTHFEAWRMLGSVLAQIGREPAAIQAFNEALKLKPDSTDVMMKLAVSYTNERTYDLACQSLEQWLRMKYPQIPIPELKSQTTPPSHSELLERIEEPFIQAARLSLEEEFVDADVQVGLGVLMFSAELYELAADCFQAALRVTEPGSLKFGTQWHVLWNRYAACLGNVKDKEDMAISAYETALAAKPNFVKARHNLGILYHNINEPLLGARTILEALLWEKSASSAAGNQTRDSVGESHETTEGGIHEDAMEMYENLSKCCTSMCRWDLAELVGPDMDFEIFQRELGG